MSNPITAQDGDWVSPPSCQWPSLKGRKLSKKKPPKKVSSSFGSSSARFGSGTVRLLKPAESIRAKRASKEEEEAERQELLAELEALELEKTLIESQNLFYPYPSTELLTGRLATPGPNQTAAFVGNATAGSLASSGWGGQSARWGGDSTAREAWGEETPADGPAAEDDEDEDEDEEEEDGSRPVICWMELSHDYVDAIRDNIESYLEEVTSDIATSAGVDEERIVIFTAEAEGEDVFIEFSIGAKVPDDDDEDEDNDSGEVDAAPPRSALDACVDLYTQAQDPTSRIRRGVHTQFLFGFGSDDVETYLELAGEEMRREEKKRLDKKPTTPKSSAWTPVITVPKPFAFKATTKALSKDTITKRRQKEYLQSLKDQEKRFRSMRFKARPVPPSTFLPKYKQMTEDRMDRTREVKALAEERKRAAMSDSGSGVISARLEKQIRAYEARKRADRDRRTPLERKRDEQRKRNERRIQREIEELIHTKRGETPAQREARIRKSAREKLALSSYPPGLESHMIKQELLKKKKLEKKRREERARRREAARAKRARKIPDFDALHEEHSKTMSEAADKLKAELEMSRPVPFNLSQGSSHRKYKPEPIPKWKRKVYVPPKDVVKPAKTTRSFQLMRQSAIGRLWALQKKAEDEEKLVAQGTYARGARPSREVKQQVRSQVKSLGGTAALRRVKMKQRVEAAQQSLRTSVRDYASWVDSIKTKVQTRPLLMETEKHAQTRLDQRRKTLTSIKRSLEEAGVTEFHGFFNPEELEELGLSSWLTSRKRFSRTKKRVKKIKGAVETNPAGAAAAEAGDVNVESAEISQEQKESKKLEPEVVNELLGEADAAGDDDYDDDFDDATNAGKDEAGPAPAGDNAKASDGKETAKDEKVDLDSIFD